MSASTPQTAPPALNVTASVPLAENLPGQPKSKKPKKSVSWLIFPGESTWELWQFPAGESPKLDRQLDTIAAAKWTGPCTLALPAAQVHAVPLCLATKDTKLVPDLTRMQIERLGLVPQSGNPVFQIQALPLQGEVSRALTAILPVRFPADLCRDEIDRYDVSAHSLPLSGSRIYLWRELGRLVIAATEKGKLAYFQALGGDTLNSFVCLEIRTIYLQLNAMGILQEIEGITAWGAFHQNEVSLLREIFETQILPAPRPTPVMVKTAWNLLPESVQQAHTERTRSRQLQQWLASAAILYLIVAVGVAGYMAWLFNGRNMQRAWINANMPEVTQIQTVAQRWELMQGAINPEQYPLELLNRCSSVLPAEGVRLWTFEQIGRDITLVGEAKDSPTALKYQEDLKQSPDLKSYQWDMPQPKIQPNMTAHFNIKGTHGP